MAEPIIVATPFTELGELAEHFAQRVDQGRLMLPYAEAVPDGEWVPFQVLYLDGSVAIEGTGKVNGSYDNGEESPPEYRFDVVLEELALDGTSEVVFERISVARASMLADEPATGEVSLAEIEPGEALPEAAVEGAAVEEAAVEEAAVEPADLDPVEAPPAPPEEGPSARPAPAPVEAEFAPEEAADLAPPDAVEAVEDPSSEFALADTSQALDEAPAAPPPLAAPRANPRGAPVPPGQLPNPHAFSGGVLSRAPLPPVWEPTPEARPAAAAPSGLFDYGAGGLPRPVSAPRPELAPEARVRRAPAPA